jgi:hypothetical protein
MEYPTDFNLNSSKDVYVDASNDIALVSGVAQLRQSVAIDVFDETSQLIGGKVTGQDFGRIESAIRESLNDDPQLAEVQQVSVEEFNKDTNEVTVTVLTTANNEFTLPVEIA